MASQAQIDANRRNAQKSTGPTSAAGKSKAAMNALKHGLLAKEPAFVGEDPAEFKTFLEAVIADQKPQGAVQLMLVHRIAHLQWKLARVPQVEAQTVAQAAARETARRNAGREYERRPKPPVPGPGTAEVIAMDPKRFDSLQIYEQRLERSLRACLKELRELRKEMATLAELVEEDEELPPSPGVPAFGSEAQARRGEGGGEGSVAHGEPRTDGEEAPHVDSNKRTQFCSNDRPEEELAVSPPSVSATSAGVAEPSPYPLLFEPEPQSRRPEYRERDKGSGVKLLQR